MSGTKIQLSSFEMELVQNSDLILTKRTIIDKVYTLFGALSEKYISIINTTDLPAAVKTIAPKISKGENYNGLPYVVLDYPRVFDKENVFAIRTLFWWGNYFSSTLHLKGIYKKEFVKFISDEYQRLANEDFFIATGNDEWNFRFTENNYRSISSLRNNEWKELLVASPFIKLSVKIPLTKWEEATDELHRYFQINLQSAGINFQDGEINPSPGNPITGSGL